MKTKAVFFPFDLFGSGGTAQGVELLADELREVLGDNKREQVPTRARAYTEEVKIEEYTFEKLADYKDWRKQARRTIRQVLENGEFLLWITGNHLGALPVYDELSQAKRESSRQNQSTLVIQLDAHLDIHHFSDCTKEPSHGNFLRHCDGPLPVIINVGHRDLLLEPKYVSKYYREAFPAEMLATEPAKVFGMLRLACEKAERVFLDLDCDVLDPVCFPGVVHPVPFGLTPMMLLQILNCVRWDKVIGMAISEFDPGRDRDDCSLSTIVWLIERLLLRRYEPASEG